MIDESESEPLSEGFYEGPEDFGSGDAADEWCDDAPVVARPHEQPRQRSRAGEGPYGILGNVGER